MQDVVIQIYDYIFLFILKVDILLHVYRIIVLLTQIVKWY